jgi:cytochrome b6-f complex iron-sulfur subunit
MRNLTRYLEDLLGRRRPRTFDATSEDAAVVRAAITLRAARPGSDEPREAFVAELHDRLAAELEAPPEPRAQPPTRRQFVQVASVAASAAALGAGTVHALSGESPHRQSAERTLSPNLGEWRTVARTADVAEGDVRAFDLGSVVGFVTRTRGRVRAVSGICTHQSCRLAFQPSTRRLTCPCHNAAFALSGAVVTHQLRVAPAALPRLPVREVTGSVQVYAPPPGS